VGSDDREMYWSSWYLVGGDRLVVKIGMNVLLLLTLQIYRPWREASVYTTPPSFFRRKDCIDKTYKTEKHKERHTQRKRIK
jgi:hypothetical protein